MRLAGGAIGRAIAPAGASTGSGEAIELRDGGTRLGGRDVRGAVAAINGEIAAALIGMDAADQAAIDGALMRARRHAAEKPARRQCTGRGIDGRAARRRRRARKAALRLSAWRPGRSVMPLPEIQIFGGGAHAGRRVDIQDFMVVAPLAASFDQALEWTAEVYLAAGAIMAERGLLQGVADEGGFWPAFDTNEAALDALMRAIERAGFTPGRGDRDLARHRRLRVSRRRAATGWRATAPNSIRTAWRRC